MKTLFLASALLAAPALAQTAAPTTTPAPAPTFNWKLRLTKGQKWTQILRTGIRSNTSVTDPKTKTPTRIESDIAQTVSIKNEVVDATPAFYLVRSTYTAFKQNVSVKINGKTPPGPAPKMPDVSQALVGASFTLKQAPDGRVLDITGLEDMMARQQRMMNTLFKTPQESATFKQFMPSAAAYKAALTKSQSVALPPTPLAVGQAYSYALSLPASFVGGAAVTGKRTLRSFDAQSATFDETSTFDLPGTKAITTGTGAAQAKTFLAMKGTVSGQSVVDAQSGLPRSSAVTTKITGKVTLVQAGGTRISVPMNATSQTTITTTPQ